MGLRDLRAKVAIARRIEQAENGNLGETRSVGSGVSEMKIDLGPGYRVYFTAAERSLSSSPGETNPLNRPISDEPMRSPKRSDYAQASIQTREADSVRHRDDS